MSDHDSQSNAGGDGPAHDAAPQHGRRGGGGGTVVLSVALSLIVSGAAVVAAPMWSPAVSRMVGIADPLRRIEQDAARVARAQTETDGRVTALTERVGALAAGVAGDAEATARLRTVALALAVGELRTALRRTGPFDVELATLRTLAAGDADLEKAIAGLDTVAGQGVPSRTQLRGEFPRAAAAAVNAAAPAPDVKQAGAWYASVTSAWDQFRYLVRLDTPPADSAYAAAQRARARLADDDLAGAAEELAAAPGPQDTATADWIAQAQARVVADRAAAALTTLALSRVAAR